jgi:DNA-binding protein H-NS
VTSLSELMAQKQALEKRIEDARRSERAEAISRIRELMEQYGLTPADLKPGAARQRKGGKVPAKYRDPDTGDAWSGRGLQPNWLKAALASGRKLSDFAVK